MRILLKAEPVDVRFGSLVLFKVVKSLMRNFGRRNRRLGFRKII